MIHGAGPREVRLARLRHGAPRSSPRSVAGELTVSPFSAPIARQFIGRRLASALFRVLDVVTVSGCFSGPPPSERTRAAHPSLRYSRFPPRGFASSVERVLVIVTATCGRETCTGRDRAIATFLVIASGCVSKSRRCEVIEATTGSADSAGYLHPRIVRGSAYMEGQPWPVAWGAARSARAGYGGSGTIRTQRRAWTATPWRRMARCQPRSRHVGDVSAVATIEQLLPPSRTPNPRREVRMPSYLANG